MYRLASPSRTAAPARRAARALPALRALAGAVAVAALAGCGLITESDPDESGGLAGSYELTHHNGRLVPTVTEDDEQTTEELLSGSLSLAAGSDSTFSLSTVERLTYKQTGRSETSTYVGRGIFTTSGDAVRLTVTSDEDGPRTDPWTMTATLRDGVLHVDFGDGPNDVEVVSFRKR